MRVTFSKVAPIDVSIIAQPRVAGLGPYQTEAGGKIQLLRVRTAPARG